MVGTVSAHRSGFGFVKSGEMAESMFLPPAEMTRLMHGDLVRVQASQGSDERWSGSVVDVLERGVAAFLGTISIQGRSASVNSADRRLNLYCIVAPADLNGARNGDWVIARVVKYPLDGQAGTAKVELLLDPEKPLDSGNRGGDCEAGRCRANSRRKRFAMRKRMAATWIRAKRRDAWTCATCRWSPSTARTRGISTMRSTPKPMRDGFRLIVAIADVSHYVREGTTA